MRTLVLCCPEWSVVAAGAVPDQPLAVVHANRVIASSPAARFEGVTPGLRRREAQGRCPGLEVVAADPARDARAFEPLAVALDVLTPRIEMTRPGTIAFATHGPSRYFGGDDALTERVVALATEVLGPRVDVAGPPVVGVADSAFAAELAGSVVAPGATATFLAPLPTSVFPVIEPELGFDDLVDLLSRLGVRTLGKLAGAAGVRCRGALRSPRRPGPSTRERTATDGCSTSAPSLPTSRSRPSSIRPPSVSTTPRSWPRRWPTSCRSGSTLAGWPARASRSKPRPSTASISCGCGVTKEVSLLRRSPSERAGSSTGGCTPRNGRRAASRCCASCPTRSVRPEGTRWGSGEVARSPTSEPHARWRACKACSASTRCRCPRCAAVAHRVSTSRSFPSASPSPGG